MQQRGISIIGAVFTLLILAIFGGTLVSLVAVDQEHRRLQIEKGQAFYEVQAGLEYALYEIKNGGFPVVSNKPFEDGTFTVNVNYPNHLIFVTGYVGDVSKTHQITYNQMGGDCLGVNNNQATLVGPNKTDLKAITLKKNCNNAITIDKMQLIWAPDNSEKVTKIEIKNVEVYNEISGSGSGEIIDIADYMLDGGSAEQISLIQFTSNMLNKDLTIVFYLSDTSYKTTQFKILPPNQN